MARLCKALGLSLLLVVSACSHGVPLAAVEVPPQPQPVPVRLAVEPDERPYVAADQPEWGLALSGGGLRSAMFSLGVVKGLWDVGLFQRLDMISSVSGGGYTATWLYDRHAGGGDGDGDGTRPFASGLLQDSRFPGHICHFMAQSRFVPYGMAIASISPALSRSSARLYERRLAAVFGSASGRTMADLRRNLAPGRVPFLIQNASVEDRTRPWHRRLVEFTPLAWGNAQVRYPWPENHDAQMTLVKTTALSGAAFPPLYQRVTLADPGSNPPGAAGFLASDGGRSENLGAFALIRRGVRNVIIADAEHDPDYIFDAYRTLRAGLATHGLALRVPLIEDHLLHNGNAPFAHWLAPGEVREISSQRLVSTIHYIKASLTPATLAGMNEPAPDYLAGRAEDERLEAALDATRQRGRDWHCDAVAAPAGFALREWATFRVGTYARWLQNSRKSRLMRHSPAVGAVINFPQYSTYDQSFYTDQTRALIGLGYLEALELRRVAGQSAQ